MSVKSNNIYLTAGMLIGSAITIMIFEFNKSQIEEKLAEQERRDSIEVRLHQLVEADNKINRSLIRNKADIFETREHIVDLESAKRSNERQKAIAKRVMGF